MRNNVFCIPVGSLPGLLHPAGLKYLSWISGTWTFVALQKKSPGRSHAAFQRYAYAANDDMLEMVAESPYAERDMDNEPEPGAERLFRLPRQSWSRNIKIYWKRRKIR